MSAPFTEPGSEVVQVLNLDVMERRTLRQRHDRAQLLACMIQSDSITASQAGVGGWVLSSHSWVLSLHFRRVGKWPHF